MKSLMWVKNITKFLRFCYLNIPCLRIIITVIFMNSSSDEFSICRKNQRQMFLLVSGGHIGAPQMDTNMASSYKVFKIWVKHFFEYFAYKILHRPDSWWAFWIFILYFPDSELYVLNGLHFYSHWRDTAWKQRICSPAIVCYTTISSVFTQCSWRGALHGGTKNGFVAD